MLRTSELLDTPTEAIGDPVDRVRLDLLRLPAPEVPLLRCKHSGLHKNGKRSTSGINMWVALIPPRDPRARSWFRWMVGHHVAFGTWRLLADLLQTTTDRRDQPCRVFDLAGGLYDVYSALLLYAGSCSPEIYAEVIRDRMAARDPALSGTWARDYERLRRLTRVVVADSTSSLKRAIKFNKLVHMTVAKRLVPAGHSLLQEAGRAGDAVTDADRDTLDEFFLVERVRVCHAELFEQLTLRIVRIQFDLAAHRLDVHYGRPDIAEAQAMVADKLTWLIEALPATADLITHHDHGQVAANSREETCAAR